MSEKKLLVDGVEISYMRKSARYDAKHLVVVFSGFSGNGKPTYNHSNTLTHCPAEVVWIKDQFFGGESYYLCAHGQFNLEASIYKFILQILNELHLTVEDCTLLGGSKGGSAALYYGLKYNFGNIVAAVPQFHMGSYVRKFHPYSYKHIVHSLSESEAVVVCDKLDRMITDAARSSRTHKNVYLVTSLSDVQYESEIIENVDCLRKFSNFNLLMANSDLIRQHNQVVVHTLAATLSIVNLSVMGLSPKFANEDLKFRKLSSPSDPSLIPFVRLKKFRIADGKYYPEGVSVIRGLSCESYSDISIQLILRSQESELRIPLAKGNNPNLTRELFDGDLVVYDKGWFCTIKYGGLPIDDLPQGVWSGYIEISSKGVTREAALTADKAEKFSGVGLHKRMDLQIDATCSAFSISVLE